MGRDNFWRGAKLKIAAGFVMLFLTCVVATLAGYENVRANHWVNHSLHIRQVLAQLYGDVRKAESGQRGYLLTGDPRYLDPYQKALLDIPPTESSLRQLTVDNGVQQALLNQLFPLIDKKLAELKQTIQLHDQSQDAAALALVKTGVGHQLMTRIETLIGQMNANELDLFQHRLAVSHWERSAFVFFIFLTTLLAAIIARRVYMEGHQQHLVLVEKNKELVEQMHRREAAEMQLRQAQKMEALGQLTGGVAHDFNNMLAVVVGNLEMAIRRVGENDTTVRNFVKNALAGAMRGADLTKRLLAFSRMQPLQPKSIDVNECVRNISSILRRSLGEDIEIEAVAGGGLWRAYIDRPQLESALLNLAVNSRDAMKSRGKLTIETSNAYLDQAYASAQEEVKPGQYVLLAVSDTGSGMPPEVLQRAFDPFFTTKEVGKGTGLGLSQVHGFIKQSGGHIKIYTELDVGTTIKMYLPRASAESDAEAFAESLESLAHAPKKILIVEDDADVRQFVVACVEELGYAALQAHDAESARARLAMHPDIALLLTDVVMPGTNGKQLADSVKLEYPQLQVLYMTGYTRNAIVHNGMVDAGVRLISKPFTMHELARELRAIFAMDAA